jgi:DNA-binding MarR family transcriptional regulator
MTDKPPPFDANAAETGSPSLNTLGARRAASADGGIGIERMLQAKLWDNPCWMAFRVNYLALRYNTPLYDWIQRTYGLSRAEYVVIYSLALTDGGQARDIAETSGFPRNTLSRAIGRLEELDLITREHLPGGGRGQLLSLSEAGWRLFGETLPAFRRFEQMMLSALEPDEQETLAELLAKIVLAGDDWPESLNDPAQDLPDPRVPARPEWPT